MLQNANIIKVIFFSADIYIVKIIGVLFMGIKSVNVEAESFLQDYLNECKSDFNVDLGQSLIKLDLGLIESENSEMLPVFDIQKENIEDAGVELISRLII